MLSETNVNTRYICNHRMYQYHKPAASQICLHQHHGQHLYPEPLHAYPLLKIINCTASACNHWPVHQSLCSSVAPLKQEAVSLTPRGFVDCMMKGRKTVNTVQTNCLRLIGLRPSGLSLPLLSPLKTSQRDLLTFIRCYQRIYGLQHFTPLITWVQVCALVCFPPTVWWVDVYSAK